MSRKPLGYERLIADLPNQQSTAAPPAPPTPLHRSHAGVVSIFSLLCWFFWMDTVWHLHVKINIIEDWINLFFACLLKNFEFFRKEGGKKQFELAWFSFDASNMVAYKWSFIEHFIEFELKTGEVGLPVGFTAFWGWLFQVIWIIFIIVRHSHPEVCFYFYKVTSQQVLFVTFKKKNFKKRKSINFCIWTKTVTHTYIFCFRLSIYLTRLTRLQDID